MTFAEYLKSDKFVSGLNQTLLSLGYSEMAEVFIDKLNDVASDKYPINMVSKRVASDMNMDLERVQGLTSSIRKEVLSEYDDELSQKANLLYQEVEDFNDNFDFKVVVDKIFISAGYVFEESLKPRMYLISAKYLLLQVDDQELIDYLLKSSKVGGLGLDEYQGVKVSFELKKVLEMIKTYELERYLYPEIISGLSDFGFKPEEVMPRTLGAIKEAIDIAKEIEKSSSASKPVVKIVDVAPDLSSLLDQISKDIEK